PFPPAARAGSPPSAGSKSAADTCLELSCRLQPMLINLDLDYVGRIAAVVGPHLFLHETHPVKRLRGQAVAHLRELFRIRKAAAHALDHACVAANVIGRAYMAQRIGLHDPHRIARAEAGLSHAARGASSCAPASQWWWC